METAKVDIRKLQLLNDRINQCIEAFGQVRLSVHGLSSGFGQQGIQGLQGQPQPNPWLQGQQQGVPGYFGPQSFVPQFIGPQSFAPQPFAPQPFAPQPFAPQPFAPQFFGQQTLPYPVPQNVGFAGVPQGLAHTSALGPQQQGLGPLTGLGQIPWPSPIGLSHSNPEDVYARGPLSDPYVASRGQTFPYAHFNFSPALMY
jgi:hypothetical protein